MTQLSESAGAGKSANAVDTREAIFATGAGFLGWTLDAFDFFLVIICAPAIAKEFHVTPTRILFSTTLTLAFRPVGAFIFGLLADRFGRRTPMMIDLVFYSLVEMATAFAPSLRTFYVLRALFGIGMGGEWGVGTSLVMEKVPSGMRGMLSGLLQEGYAAGNLLAAAVGFLMLQRFGWRPMFLVGGAPALLALFIRFFIRESEIWQKNKAGSWSELLRGIAQNWKLWLYLTLLMTALNLSSHGTQDVFPTFLKTGRGMAENTYTRVVMVMSVGAILGGAIFGFASDRLGRRRMMALAFFGALLIVWPWATTHTTVTIAVSAFFMQFMVQGAWGIIPAHISELSPTRVRGFLPGFSYQCGNLMASFIAVLQSYLAGKYGYPPVMAISAGSIFVMAIIVTLAGPERRGVDFREIVE